MVCLIGAKLFLPLTNLSYSEKSPPEQILERYQPTNRVGTVFLAGTNIAAYSLYRAINQLLKLLGYQRQLADIRLMRYRNMHKTIYCSYTT